MKNLIARTLTLLMLAVLGLTMASAQTTSVIKVNVPFQVCGPEFIKLDL